MNEINASFDFVRSTNWNVLLAASSSVATGDSLFWAIIMSICAIAFVFGIFL